MKVHTHMLARIKEAKPSKTKNKFQKIKEAKHQI